MLNKKDKNELVTLITDLEKNYEKTSQSYNKFKTQYKKMFDELKKTLGQNQLLTKEKEELLSFKNRYINTQ